MNNATHTPGPWTTEGADITNGYPEQGARVFIAEKVFSEHDANLIAAAPAMYEALQWAMQYLRMPNFHPDNSYNSERWARDYNKLTDALAQAEGRR
jgi:hypothetical protein